VISHTTRHSYTNPIKTQHHIKIIVKKILKKSDISFSPLPS